MTVIRAAKYLALVDTGKTIEFTYPGAEGMELITGTLVGVGHTVDVNLVHEVTRSKPRVLLGPGQTALEIITDLEPECAVTYRLNPEHEVQLTGTKTIR
ncbi:hypothetical protein [Glutamicibacter ardleyensis]|uniref:hypothetical protein n=1 Tax=Glutamicibacter ardleyensis TaxID=225894 RepID=UPI003FD3391F